MTVRDDRGQALVEVLWLVPVTVAAVIGVLGAGLWLAARSTAGSAAEAAAIAVIGHSDPRLEARRVIPGWQKPVLVEASGGTVRVRVTQNVVPGLVADLTEAEVRLRIAGRSR